MTATVKVFLVIFVILALTVPVYADKEEAPNPGNAEVAADVNPPLLKDKSDSQPIVKPIVKEKNTKFTNWFNSKAYASALDEKEKTRQEWKEFLGVDVFLPYFKVKQAEDLVKEKTTVSFFNFKGKAEFSDDYNQVRYIFKKKF